MPPGYTLGIYGYNGYIMGISGYIYTGQVLVILSQIAGGARYAGVHLISNYIYIYIYIYM